MSVLGTFVGNVALPSTLNLAGTSITDLVTATDDSITAASISFANATVGAVECSFYWYQARTATDFMIWIQSVPAKSTVTISDIPIRLAEGDKIKVVGAAGVRATAINMLNYAMSR